MKLNKYFMIGAMGLSLVACSDNLDDNQGVNGNASNEGSTYAALKIDFNSSSRATGDQPVDGDGTTTPPKYDDDETTADNEAVLNTVTIVVTDQATNRVEFCGTYSAENKTLEDDNTYVFQIEPGVKNFFAYANQTVSAKVGDQWTGTETSSANVATLAPYESQQTEGAWTKWFAMSSTEVVSQTIVDDVEEAEVESSENVVNITIERMVAKVTAQLADKFDSGEKPFGDQPFTVSAITAQIANADNLSWNGTQMDGGAASYYIAQNNASGARVTPEAYYTYPNSVTWENFDEADLLWGEKAEDLYTPAVTDNKTPQVRFYCKENTHAAGNYKQSNTTFLRVVATMYPNKVVQFACATQDQTKTISVSAGTAPSAAATFYRVLNTNDGNNVGTYVMASQLAELYGAGDDDVVNSGAEEETDDAKAAAVVAELEKSYDFKFSKPYRSGNGYYNVWVNDLMKSDGSDKNIAPVFRNDWYDLTIQNIQLPGDPDPTIDPNEPIHPNTFMAVKLAVRKWNLVEHNVDLQ